MTFPSGDALLANAHTSGATSDVHQTYVPNNIWPSVTVASNDCRGVLNHQPLDYLSNTLFSDWSQRKHQRFPSLAFVRGGHWIFPSQGASNVESASMWWHHHVVTHWGRVTHICVNELTIIGSDNGLSPNRRQAIIWTNAGILIMGPLGTNFSEILFEIHTF